MNEFDKAKKLWACIGEISDAILEETELADIAAEALTVRKRYVKYGALAAAATVGVAATTFFLLRLKRVTANA